MFKYKEKAAIVIAAIAVAAAALVYYVARVENPFEILYLPVELTAKGLRNLSLHSGFGNVVAIILFILISLIPIYFFAFRVKNKRQDGIDILLILQSGFIFFILYAFINPSVISSMQPAIGDSVEMMTTMKGILVLFLYSLFIAYGAVWLASKVKRVQFTDHKREGFKWLRVILSIFINLYLFFIVYGGIFHLLAVLSKPAASDTAIEIPDEVGFSDYSLMAELISFIAVLIPVIFMTRVIFMAIEVLDELELEKYTEEVVKQTENVAHAASDLVYCSVICGLISNGMQLIPGLTPDVNLLVGIPIVPLIVAFAAMVLAKYFKASNTLYEDQQSII